MEEVDLSEGGEGGNARGRGVVGGREEEGGGGDEECPSSSTLYQPWLVYL